MTNLKRSITFILILLTFAACARAGAESQTVSGGASPFDIGPGASIAEVAEAPTSQGEGAGGFAQDQVQEQLIIRTGNLEIIVENTETAIDEITNRVNGAGGWVVTSDVFQRGGDKSGNMTVRVPVEQFDSMLAQIEGLAIEVVNRSTSGEDVTEEYVDRRARLENLEATADRVRSFLEEARNVEEALAVNAELSRLESDIEAMRGRIQYLEQSAAFSTINVYVTPDALAQPLEIGGWRATGVLRDAASTLISALQGLATILIYVLVVLLPLALLVLLPVAVVYLIIRRRRAAAPPEVAEPASEA